MAKLTAMQRLENKNAYQTARVCSGNYVVKDETGYIWEISQVDNKKWAIRSLKTGQKYHVEIATLKGAIAHIRCSHGYIRSFTDPNSAEYKERVERRKQVDQQNLQAIQEVSEYTPSLELFRAEHNNLLVHPNPIIRGIFVEYLPEQELAYKVVFYHNPPQDEENEFIREQKCFSNAKEAGQWVEAKLLEVIMPETEQSMQQDKLPKRYNRTVLDLIDGKIVFFEPNQYPTFWLKGTYWSAPLYEDSRVYARKYSEEWIGKMQQILLTN